MRLNGVPVSVIHMTMTQPCISPPLKQNSLRAPVTRLLLMRPFCGRQDKLIEI